MKNKFLVSLISIILIPSLSCFSQEKEEVWDILGMEALIAQHKGQYKGFQDIMVNELELTIINNQYKKKMEDLKEVEVILYNSLKDVKILVANVKDAITIAEITAEIIQHQSKILEMASGDTELLTIATKTELELVKKTIRMGRYVIQAVTGSDLTLANNSQRDELLKYIVSELRVMRGLSYSIYRQMKTARRANMMQNLDVENFKY